jgi:DNA repair protein RAD7
LTWGDNGTAGAGANADAAANGGADEGHLAHDGPVIGDGEELDPAGAVTARNVEAGPSTVNDTTPTKRKRSASIDSDDLDTAPVPAVVEKKGVGEFMDCAECSKRFTVVSGLHQ